MSTLKLKSMTMISLTQKRIYCALAFALILSFSSCRSTKSTTSQIETKEPVTQEIVKVVPPPEVNNKVEKKEEIKKEAQIFSGMATYYNDLYQGKPTASGEPYDRNKYTASIRLNTVPLPYGTKVEVFSVKRNKKVIVKVNDKMGDKASAIIDLSYKAAEEIGLIIDGRTQVILRVVEDDEK